MVVGAYNIKIGSVLLRFLGLFLILNDSSPHFYSVTIKIIITEIHTQKMLLLYRIIE